MKKTQIANLNIATIVRNGLTEFFIHTQCKSLAAATDAMTELFSFLGDNSASAANFRIFATGRYITEINGLYGAKLDAMCCPITWISQDDKETLYPFSIQVHAVSGAEVTPVVTDEQKNGCRFSDNNADYALLQLLPKNKQASNFDQAACVFNQMQTNLQSVGLDFSNTLRTWLFADDILAWYDKLNQARDDFFNKYDIFNKLVPASTGVGICNPTAHAITTELIAAKAKNENVTIEKIVSPMQCEALDYKSSFSRATKLTAPDHSRMYVSGTASIEPGGETVFLDDTAKQIDMTMKVADALIKNGGMDWNNVVRAMAYVKDSAEFDLFDAWCTKNGIDIPHVKIEADICRHDLLFEIEMTLIST
ncbi:MAG: Rid family hydrolase [Planctomycetota bacterium]